MSSTNNDQYAVIVELLHEAFKMGLEFPKDTEIAFAGDPIELNFRNRANELIDKVQTEAKINELKRLRRRFNGTNYVQLRKSLDYRIAELNQPKDKKG